MGQGEVEFVAWVEEDAAPDHGFAEFTGGGGVGFEQVCVVVNRRFCEERLEDRAVACQDKGEAAILAQRFQAGFEAVCECVEFGIGVFLFQYVEGG